MGDFAQDLNAQGSDAQDSEAASSLPDTAKPPAGHRSARRKIPSPQYAADLLRATAQGFFSVLLPSNCRFCESPLLEISRLPVCTGCLDAIHSMPQGEFCRRCGERLLGAQVEGAGKPPVCGNCQLEEPAFAKAAAYGTYDQGMRDLIHLLKYEQVRPAATVLGKMLAQVIARIAQDFGSQTPLVVPVPLHSSRLRQRGFNHSELIARAAIKLRPAGRTYRIAPAALVRRRATESQTGLTQAQRRANVRGAFHVPPGAVGDGCDVLLVDDVYTTGTTVSECARVLKKAGAGRVWVATVARVLREDAASLEPVEQQRGDLAMAARSG